MLIEIAYTDIKTQIITNKTVLFVFGIGILCIISEGFGKDVFISKFSGFLAAGGIFYVIAVVSRGGMGGGDIKLIAALGLCFGLAEIILIIALSFVIGAAFSVFFMLTRKKTRKDAIPFGPSIAAAAYVCMLFGKEMINFYLAFM